MRACLSHRIEVVHTGPVYKHEFLLGLTPVYWPFITLRKGRVCNCYSQTMLSHSTS